MPTIPGFEAGAQPPGRHNPSLTVSALPLKLVRLVPSRRGFEPRSLTYAEDTGIEPVRTGLQPVALPTELIFVSAGVTTKCLRSFLRIFALAG